MKNKTSRPMSVTVLLTLVLFQAVSGIGGGVGLILDPTGESMQIPLEWLHGSPFTDYLIPGIVLFSALGVFPLVVFYGLLTKKKYAWHASLLVSLALVIWIGAEIAIIGYQANPPLQLIYGSVGLVLLLLTLLPSVRRHYNVLTGFPEGRQAAETIDGLDEVARR